MKFSIFSFLFISVVAFNSCNKNSIFDKDDKKEFKDDDEKGCFELVYPVTYTMPDGSAINMDDEDDWEGIKAWYEDHPDSEAKPSLNYPVEIIWEDETAKTINNDDEMIKAKKGCDDEWDKDCFKLVYPVDYTMPDGSSITMNNEDDWDVIKAWYEDHPDVAAKPALQYPVEILWEDGDTQTINNEDEMIVAKEDCNDDDDDDGNDDDG